MHLKVEGEKESGIHTANQNTSRDVTINPGEPGVIQHTKFQTEVVWSFRIVWQPWRVEDLLLLHRLSDLSEVSWFLSLLLQACIHYGLHLPPFLFFFHSCEKEKNHPVINDCFNHFQMKLDRKKSTFSCRNYSKHSCWHLVIKRFVNAMHDLKPLQAFNYENPACKLLSSAAILLVWS